MRSLHRAVRYLAGHKALAAATLLAAILTTLMELIPPWLIKRVIDDVVRGGRAALLPWLIAAMAGAYLVKSLSNMIRIRLNNRLEQRVIFDIRSHVFESLQRLSISYFENRSTGEIMSRVNNDVDNLERIFIDGIEHLAVAALTLIGVAAMLFYINVHLALITLLPIPFLAISATLFTRKIHRLYHLVRGRLAMLNAYLQDSLSGIRETFAFNRQGYELTRFNRRSRDYCDGNVMVAKMWSLYSPGMALLAGSGTVLILWFGGRSVLAGTLTVGELVAFIAYAGQFYTPINQIHSINHMLQHALAAGDRVFEVIDALPEVRETERPVSPVLPARGEVRFEEVSFNYVSHLPVLKRISFEVLPGESIALVGATGSGKSTIVSLLMRFYDIDAGRITLDGIDIRNLTLHDLREQIGLVRQEPFLFNGTIRENIAYGNLSADERAVVRSAKAAAAHEFIEKLPQGYDTWIGERGVKLSIGQKQRLAIARAFLKDPPVIIFDEGTSSVDAETEEKIQEALKRLFNRRTTIIVAHRLSSLRGAERILVVEGGEIVETGSHDELLQRSGTYLSLFEGQLSI
ncbi:MAG TPA: ABC transporter ATP-binding protein [Nitrospiria bacterium]|nr:ABC transporter ATP-binding protein [Nitrospiria bacterium]